MGVSAVYGWLSRHPRLVDGVPAAILLLLGIGTGLSGGAATTQVVSTQDGQRTTVFSAASAFGRGPAILLLLLIVLAMAVPVVFRRTYPVQAFTVAAVAGGLQVLFITRPLGTDLAILILLYTLAAYRPRRQSIVGLCVCLAGSLVAVARWLPIQDGLAQKALFGGVIFSGTALVAWVLGDSMRYRRAYLTSLEDRAAPSSVNETDMPALLAWSSSSRSWSRPGTGARSACWSSERRIPSRRRISASACRPVWEMAVSAWAVRSGSDRSA